MILLLLMFFMRKRVALTIALFHVAGKVFTHLPLLALQPFWTFLTLMLFWVYWITVLLFLGTAGLSAQTNEGLGWAELQVVDHRAGRYSLGVYIFSGILNSMVKFLFQWRTFKMFKDRTETWKKCSFCVIRAFLYIYIKLFLHICLHHNSKMKINLSYCYLLHCYIGSWK